MVAAVIFPPKDSNVTSVTSSTSAQSFLTDNSNRKGMIVFNDSTSVLNLWLGKGGKTKLTTSLYSVEIAAGGYWEPPWPGFAGEVWGLWATANGVALVTELF